MISPRFVPAIAVLFAIAFVPTLLHGYLGLKAEDGRTTGAVPMVVAGYRGIQSARNETWGLRRFSSDDWTERIYRRGTEEITLTIVRSYDPKALYHHPELAIAYGTSFKDEIMATMPERPEIPIHLLRPAEGTAAQAMYVLHYNDRFIVDPVLFQIRTAGELLFTRRRPMTIFFALREGGGLDPQRPNPGTASLLLGAIDAFLNQGASRTP